MKDITQTLLNEVEATRSFQLNGQTIHTNENQYWCEDSKGIKKPVAIIKFLKGKKLKVVPCFWYEVRDGDIVTKIGEEYSNRLFFIYKRLE